MATINAHESLINSVNELCSPIEFALQNDENAKLFFRSLGWDFDRIDGFPFNNLVSSLNSYLYSVLDVRALLENSPKSIEEFIQCLVVVESLFNAIDTIASFINGISGGGITTAFKAEFSKLPIDIINYLVCGYIENNYFTLYASLSVLGGISPHQVGKETEAITSSDEKWVRLPYFKSVIHLNNVVDLLSNPVEYFKQQFYPTSGLINSATEAQEFCDKFFPRVELLFQSLGFDTLYGMDDSDESLCSSEAFSAMRRTLTLIYHDSDFAD